MQQPFVSIVIPTYNRAYCLGESIDSVLRQTYQNMEVIVVDDGSTDETQELVTSIDDSRVRYVWQKNAGACTARNHGISLAKGPIVALHDSDDLWLPTKLEKQVKALQRSNADFSICRMRAIHQYDTGERTPARIIPDPGLTQEDLTLERLVGKSFVSTQMFVGRKEVFANTPFDSNMPRLQDWDFAIRLFAKYRCVFVEDVLVEQIMRPDSISNNPQRLIAAAKTMETKHSAYLKAHPAAHAQMLSTVAKTLYMDEPKETIRTFLKSFSISHNPVELAHAMHICLLSLFFKHEN